MKPPRHWTPLTRVTQFKNHPPELLRATMDLNACDETTARQILQDQSAPTWANELYQVMVFDEGDFWHINIRRRDGNPMIRDWRHFQEIKNQLCGPESEGVELYPAESRKVDTSNKYHIYVLKPNRTLHGIGRFPFGWQDRDVDYNGGTIPGLKQRPL